MTSEIPEAERARVAVIMTTWFEQSHADVGCRRLIEGYPWQGQHRSSRIEVVSAYLEQPEGARTAQGRFRPDVGREVLARNAVPCYPTIAETLGCGRPGVNVDGVVIIGEHGDYEYNEFGQKLYPRRRFFDSAVSAMISADDFVPVFTDKHLAWNFADARAMYDTARRLGIPMLAGSSVPIAWRKPSGAQWPFGAPMTEIVLVGFGGMDIYDFHNLEAMQSQAERRAGGETGVARVHGLAGADAAAAIADGAVNLDLLDRALRQLGVDSQTAQRARTTPQNIIQVDYHDGLRGTIVNCQGILKGFAAAAHGPGDDLTCEFWLEPWPPSSHWIFFMRQVESLMIHRRAPYPVERTLLTTGIHDLAARSRHLGSAVDTPELAISYSAPDTVPETGLDYPLPKESR